VMDRSSYTRPTFCASYGVPTVPFWHSGLGSLRRRSRAATRSRGGPSSGLPVNSTGERSECEEEVTLTSSSLRKAGAECEDHPFSGRLYRDLVSRGRGYSSCSHVVLGDGQTATFQRADAFGSSFIYLAKRPFMMSSRRRQYSFQRLRRSRIGNRLPD